jgi:hypothetical protein
MPPLMPYCPVSELTCFVDVELPVVLDASGSEGPERLHLSRVVRS